MARRTVLILSGEPSGDVAGGRLAAALREADPEVRLLAVGGRHLRDAGAEILQDIAELSAMGFAEVVRQIPKLKDLERRLQDVMERERPDVVVPIDYPGFNLRIAAWAKEHGRRVVWYIGPQVWAWGAKRIPKIASAVHRMLVVFPFEEDLYGEAGLPTTFVGHPLMESVVEAPSRAEARRELGIPDDRPLLGLLAGSRVQEVRRLLPVMLETAQAARREISGLEVVASAAADVPADEYQPAHAANVPLHPGRAATLIAAADALLVTSGTATLESALIGTPLAVLYRTSPLTWFIGTRVVRIDRISLVNIVAEEDLAPEFLQHDARADRILPWVLETLGDGEARVATRDRLRRLRSRFEGRNASREAARIILEEAEA